MKYILLPLFCVYFSACASSPKQSEPSPADKFESFNRASYAFNDRVDRAITKPLAKGYTKITPKPVRRGIDNFLDNLLYPRVIVNQLLQGKPLVAAKDLSRLVMNTTFGLAGIFDVAENYGLPENEEDFGQTLAVWGMPSGPYLMVPLLGPSTFRDAPARAVDIWMRPERRIDDDSFQTGVLIVDLINRRAGLLSAEDAIQASYDPYIFIREAYLQNRRYKVYDGDPPVDQSIEDELLDDMLDDLDDEEDDSTPDPDRQ